MRHWIAPNGSTQYIDESEPLDPVKAERRRIAIEIHRLGYRSIPERDDQCWITVKDVAAIIHDMDSFDARRIGEDEPQAAPKRTEPRSEPWTDEALREAAARGEAAGDQEKADLAKSLLAAREFVDKTQDAVEALAKEARRVLDGIKEMEPGADAYPLREMASSILDGKAKEELMLESFDGTVFKVGMSHWASRLLVENLRKTVGDAPNFMELAFHAPGETWLVTVHRPDGRRPAEIIRELKDKVAELEKDRVDATWLREALDLDPDAEAGPKELLDDVRRLARIGGEVRDLIDEGRLDGERFAGLQEMCGALPKLGDPEEPGAGYKTALDLEGTVRTMLERAIPADAPTAGSRPTRSEPRGGSISADLRRMAERLGHDEGCAQDSTGPCLACGIFYAAEGVEALEAEPWEAAAREWCEASNKYSRACDDLDRLCHEEKAAHALLPKIEYDDKGDALPDAWKDYGPHNPAWAAWAEVNDRRSAAQDRAKAAVGRYNKAHAALFKLAGVVASDDELLDEARHLPEVEPRNPRERQTAMAGLTYDEIVKACANVGVDLSCGACAAVFFTGIGAGDHTCTQPVQGE